MCRRGKVRGQGEMDKMDIVLGLSDFILVFIKRGILTQNLIRRKQFGHKVLLLFYFFWGVGCKINLFQLGNIYLYQHSYT